MDGVPVKLLLEFLMTAGLALLFHAGLHMEREAYTVLAVGLLLTVAIHLLQVRLVKLQAAVLDAVGRLQPLHSLADLVGDAEAARKGHALMETTHSVLAMLRQGEIPLTESEYYYEATQSLSRCTHLVQAVNAVDITDWIGKVQKRNYYRAQVEASRRGVDVCRIFVLHHVELASPDLRRTIKSQLDDGVTVYVVLREDLRFSGGLGTGEGIEDVTNFVLFDQQEAIVRTSLLGIYYGKKVRLPRELARYERMYRILHQHARSAEDVLHAPPADAEVTEDDPAQSHMR